MKRLALFVVTVLGSAVALAQAAGPENVLIQVQNVTMEGITCYSVQQAGSIRREEFAFNSNGLHFVRAFEGTLDAAGLDKLRAVVDSEELKSLTDPKWHRWVATTPTQESWSVLIPRDDKPQYFFFTDAGRDQIPTSLGELRQFARSASKLKLSRVNGKAVPICKAPRMAGSLP